MTRSYVRLLVLTFLGSCFVPLVVTICSGLHDGYSLLTLLSTRLILSGVAAILLTIAVDWFLKRIESHLDERAREQTEFIDTLPGRYVVPAIVGSAALSLFLELVLIRWQGSIFEFFAFYKNFGLLACFAGLGLGYALASRDRIPLVATIPLLAWQFVLMMGLRFGFVTHLSSLRVLPFSEQVNMGLAAAGIADGVATYFFLSVVFLLVVLTFLPIGQLCGRLMEREEKLPAYGWNLLGSLLGVGLALLASLFWTPPVVWFAVCFGWLLLFHARKQSQLLLSLGCTVAGIVILAWPVNPLWQKIYSPYQMLEVGTYNNGLMMIRASGYYYQRVFDFSGSAADPNLTQTRNYYDLPFRVAGKPPADVAVVGAGSGNDVAAALRSGAAHVDAIEIDPAIMMLGKANHPEKPYDNPRVRPVVNDARSFFRTTNKKYDMIVYGLLDSHTLLSQASSVRLDSFVYTVEGLREARARLKDGGLLSLSFSTINNPLGRKIYLMLQEAFDGRPPVCVIVRYDGATAFLESNNGNVVLPAGLLNEVGFQDRSAYYKNLDVQTDVSTDDWPFFYMPKRVYPITYLPFLVLIALMSMLVTRNFIAERPQFSSLAFFFLGAGFMLVETKGITEMGLTFGNTWQVIGVVIASILAMAFLANCAVQWLKIKSSVVPYALLLVSLAVGWFISLRGGFASTPGGRLETAIALTCPIFFSGIVFSTLLNGKGKISGIMAINLLGAMFGGLLEYNSMYFGFRFLYLLSIALYVLAFASSRLTFKGLAFGFGGEAEASDS